MKFVPKSKIARIIVFPVYAVAILFTGMFIVALGLVITGHSTAGDVSAKPKVVVSAQPTVAATAKPTAVSTVDNQLAGNKKLCDAARHAHSQFQKVLDANVRNDMSDADFIDVVRLIGDDLFALATEVDTPEGSIDSNIAQAGLRWGQAAELARKGADAKSVGQRIGDGIVLWDTASKECAAIGH
jgi:hypothetical protein